jgi:arginyl-tRNA synthetase
MSLVARVTGAVGAALSRLAEEGKFGPEGVRALSEPRWLVEKPKRPEHGDFATNAAMVLTKRVGIPPRALAETLVAELKSCAEIAHAEIAGPGFVNLRVAPALIHAELEDVRRAAGSYGRRPSASGERIHLEFVSANPTGPITVASARNAIIGDSLGRLLEATGNRVTREYYINDFGNQVMLFAESVLARAEGRDVPEDGYRGAYIEDVAQHLRATEPAVLTGPKDALARACIGLMVGGIEGSSVLPGIRRSLSSLGVDFDVWFSEESLHRWGHVQRALAKLQASGHLREQDGATFFVTKNEDDDKARAVKKSDGSYTYFASDVAYLSNKVERGYDRLMIVLGADHHGYVPRLRNALDALGFGADKLEAFLYQLVFIYRGGELVKSSKRAGNVITSEEVMEEIDEAAGREGAGRDALRFFFLSRSMNSQVEFDVELAKKKSLDNPVFYVQYGHARLCSILKKADAIGIPRPARLDAAEWAELSHPDELRIALKVTDYPVLLAEAAAQREPHRIVFYVQELAREFQSYFTRLKSDPILPPESVRANPEWKREWNHEKTAARLAWVEATRDVFREALALLGVSAPERMDRPPEESPEEPGADEG